jgi:aquaporin TIP/aquaporin related protein
MITKALGTFVFILFIHIQVHEDTKITNNDVAGIGLIASALYIGRALTTHTGGTQFEDIV